MLGKEVALRPPSRHPLPPLNLLHLSALRQFVHQLVEVAHLLRKRRGDVLDAVAAYRPGDEVCVGI